MRLSEWQKRFSDGVRLEAPDAPVLFHDAQAPALAARFSVYRDGFWLRVSESLLDDFPLTTRLVGKTGFEDRIRNFLAVKEGYELELGELSPAFAAFVMCTTVSPALARALRIDLLAIEARRAPEPVALSEGPSFGLHPSVRLLESAGRSYVLWRAEGDVCRERSKARALRLLECFREPAGVQGLGLCLQVLDEKPEYVQGAVAYWTGLGVIVSYSPAV